MAEEQPKALRALAEAIKGWNSTNVWPHEDDEEIAILGHINEDGEKFPVAEINADTYFREGESLALANFYAAANPVAVLGLLDRIAELERWQEDVRSNSPLLSRLERAEQRVKELEAQPLRKYRLLGRGEPLRLGDQFIDDDTVSWHPVWKGLVSAGACWSPVLQPMRREIADDLGSPT